MNQKKMGLIAIVLISVFLATSIFQNCAKVNYQGNEKVSQPLNSGSVITKVSIINPAFNPQNADMKILFVVDDSYTMSQSQSRLSGALDSLLDPLFGRNVQFKIVSMSGVPDNQIDYNISSVNISPSIVQNTITNSLNNRHGPLLSLQNYNLSQYTNLKNQIKSSILSVGSNGSNIEEGFCAAVRQLFDTSSNRFFKAGDKAAIIFLTDEDDASSYSTCLSAYQQNISQSQVVYYSYLQQRARVQLEYQVNRDGIISWYPVSWSISLSAPNNFVNAGTCSPTDLTVALNKFSTMGYTVRNVTSCSYETAQSNYYGSDIGDDGSVPSKNLCASTVNVNGQTYSNLYTYVTAANHSAVAGTCLKQTVASSSITASSNFTSVIASDSLAQNAQDLRSALINKSNELFGTGFIVASIIRRNGETCALQTGQSYGTKYEQLSINLSSNSAIESMCATDFSNILSNVSTYIQNVAQRSYTVPDMSSDESIFSVAIRRNNTLTNLASNQFEAVGTTVTLTNYSLFQGDTIEVTFGK